MVQEQRLDGDRGLRRTPFPLAVMSQQSVREPHRDLARWWTLHRFHRPGDHTLTEHDVAHEMAGVRQAERQLRGEFFHLSDVVQKRRRQEQVGVRLRVGRRQTHTQRGDRDRVLEQAADVGMMAPDRCRRCREPADEPR
jgi:hypothetical protein